MALTDGLIAWWDLEEASGTRVDAHSTHDLTDNNTVLSTTGKVGDCADFERDDSESLSIPTNASLEFTGGDFTIAGWVYFEDESVAAGIISKWTYSSGTSEWVLYYRAAGAYFSFYASTGSANVGTHATTFGAASNGVWYFLACTHDSVADQLAISVNDGTKDTASFTVGTTTPTADLCLGIDQTATNYLDGRLDSWGYWSRKLSNAEITQLYNSGNGVAYSDIAPANLIATKVHHLKMQGIS